MEQQHIQNNNSVQETFATCFTYSPNWYNPQSILPFSNPHDSTESASSHIIYYASNHLLYSMHQNIVTQQISVKTAIKTYVDNSKDKALITEQQYKNMKLYSIAKLTQQILVLGLNQGIFALLNIRNLKILMVYSIKMHNINYIHCISDKAIALFDENGSATRIVFSQELKSIQRLELKISIEPNQKDRLKKIQLIGDKLYCFYHRSEIFVFDAYFQQILKRVSFGKHDSILYVDILDNQILLLSREKQQIAIVIFAIEKDYIQVQLEHTKSIHQLTHKVNRCHIDFQYPKKYNYRRDELKKAALCVKWIDHSHFLLTGKMGEVYLFDLEKPPKKDSLVLQPFSAPGPDTPYECLPDPKHYGEIYEVYRDNHTFYMIGTDRVLTRWTKNPDGTIENEMTIKFLASRVKNIFQSPTEPTSAFFLMQDSVVRTFDPTREGSGHTLSEYWKAGQKYSVKNIISSRVDQGIVVFTLTQENKAVLYDLYEQRVIKIFTLDTLEKIQIRMLSKQELDTLFKTFDFLPQNIHLQFKQMFKRKISPEQYLVAELSNSFIVIDIDTNTAFKCIRYYPDFTNTHRIVRCLVKPGLGVVCVRHNDDIEVRVYYHGQRKTYKCDSRYSGSEVWCHIKKQQPQSDNMLIVVGLAKVKFLNIILLEVQPNCLLEVKKYELQFTYPIDYASFQPVEGKPYETMALCYSCVNNSVQIWELGDRREDVKPVSKNIRAHHGNIIGAEFFMGGKYVLSVSQDQNIKMWNFSQIQEKNPPRPKKNKSKKKNKNKGNAKAGGRLPLPGQVSNAKASEAIREESGDEEEEDVDHQDI